MYKYAGGTSRVCEPAVPSTSVFPTGNGPRNIQCATGVNRSRPPDRPSSSGVATVVTKGDDDEDAEDAGCTLPDTRDSSSMGARRRREEDDMMEAEEGIVRTEEAEKCRGRTGRPGRRVGRTLHDTLRRRRSP